MSINSIPEDNSPLIEDDVSVEKIDKQERQSNVVEDEKLRRRELLERKREETRKKKEEAINDLGNSNNESNSSNNNNNKKKQQQQQQQNDPDDNDNDNVEREDEQPEKKEIKAKPKIREDQVQNAISFLNNPRVKPTALGRKVAFLERKGLTSEEIKEALRRTSGNSNSNTNTNTNTNYNTTNNDNEEEENNSTPPRSTSINTNPNINRARRTQQVNNTNNPQNYTSNPNNYGRNELEPRGGFASNRGNKGEREREYRPPINNYRDSELYDNNRQHQIASQEQPLTWKNVAMTGVTLVGIGGGLAWLTKNYVLPLIPRFKHTNTPTSEKDTVSPQSNATLTESSNIAELREQINALSKTVVSQNESLTQALRLLNANGKSEGSPEIAELRKEIQSLKGPSNQTNESSPKNEKGEPSAEIIELKQQLATLSNKLTQVSRISASQNTTYTPPPITTHNPYGMSWSPQSSGGTTVIPAWQQKGSNTSTSPQQQSSTSSNPLTNSPQPSPTLSPQSTANDSTTSVSLQTTSSTTTTTSTIQQVSNSSPQNGNSEAVSTDHPYSQSFVDIMNLVAEGKNPPGIKEIDDKPLDNEAPVNKGSKQPPLKPWERKPSPKVNAFQGLSVSNQVPPREKTVRFNVEDTYTSTTTTTSTTPSSPSPRIEEIIEPTEKKTEETVV